MIKELEGHFPRRNTKKLVQQKIRLQSAKADTASGPVCHVMAFRLRHLAAPGRRCAHGRAEDRGEERDAASGLAIEFRGQLAKATERG